MLAPNVRLFFYWFSTYIRNVRLKLIFRRWDNDMTSYILDESKSMPYSTMHSHCTDSRYLVSMRSHATLNNRIAPSICEMSTNERYTCGGKPVTLGSCCSSHGPVWAGLPNSLCQAWLKSYTAWSECTNTFYHARCIAYCFVIATNVWASYVWVFISIMVMWSFVDVDSDFWITEKVEL